MTSRKFLISIVSTIFVVVGVILLEEYTSLDVYLQNYFYDFTTGQWFISKAFHDKWGGLLYSLPKFILGFCGGLSFIFILYLLRKRSNGSTPRASLSSSSIPALCKFILALILVPSLLAGAKAVTNVHCPKSLDLYGGKAPYVRLLDTRSESYTKNGRGRCFPAGHASGGLALMVLFFGFSTPWKKWSGLALGFCAGWGMGVYQMLRGEHFLSHTLASTALAWLIILLINQAVNTFFTTFDNRTFRT